MTLVDFLSAHPEALGTEAAKFEFFPVLVKLIDAASNLSVQVHPDDAYALANEGQYGKTEMWYVVECEPGAGMYCGFKRKVSKEELEIALNNGTITDLLNFIEVKKGDCLFIKSGTVHAICGGVLVYEIQQNSTLTYRLYDYGRVGADGKPRELHIAKALEVTDTAAVCHPGDGVKKLADGVEQLGACQYFTAIVYDTTLVDSADVESEGWDVFRNPKYKGMIYMYDSERDAFMIALKALGYSMNTDNEDEINEAYEWLVEVQETMGPAYVTDEAIDGLIFGEKAMGFMYSGDAAYILSENENMAFYVPDEGTNIWTDAMVIPANADCPALANTFINYILTYEASYDNSATVGYASSNAEVLEDMTAEGGDFYGNDAYIARTDNPNDEVFRNNETLREMLSELWIKVKNS